ncbi:porin family protein [Tunicatimonas pelagia]|uniref:porin family protein n=1 Tax=Tunicatimonas pelagia TaxID=931531 RepID=UPI00266704EF|nr:porin family protein [Tunicatimonas pelagia]WKN44735.1 porin family protein [Tunicatimonas pelagia]
MKKLTLLLLFSLLASSSLLAQVSIGVKAGGALAGQTNEGVGLGEGEFAKLTYLGGFFASVPITENVSLQPEVLYSNKGSQSSGGSINLRYNLHYLSIPIMLQYRVLDRVFVELGPEFGYLLGTGTNLNNDGFGGSFSDNPSFDEQLLASYRDLDVAFNVGVGYALSDRWLVNLRYNLGLRDISDDFTYDLVGQDGSIVIANSTYNRSVQLSVGYRIF